MNNMAAADVRTKFDQYFTPPWAVRALLEQINIKGNIIEPCAGKGYIAKVLRHHGHHVVAGEIDEDLSDKTVTHVETGIDFLTAESCERYKSVNPNWCITNPPYTLKEPYEKDGETKFRIIAKASDFMKQAMEIAPNVAMLLRLGWMEACEDRREILKAMSEFHIIPRVHFEGSDGNGNSSPSVWVIWNSGPHWSEPRPLTTWADVDQCKIWKDEGWDYEVTNG